MLDHVALGAFAKDPARKDAVPLVVALILYRQLDEGAGLGRIFPRRGRLAGAQPHDRTADARAVAGLHLEIADQPVALVEQADDGDALRHRGRALDAADLGGHTLGLGDRLDGGAAIALGRAAVAAGERRRGEQRDQRGRDRARAHAVHSAPGRHAS
ncbi:hypothetical protein ATE62_21090 [Sphingopyxis sp. HIX]|nr:hypothetical protein ATE62_21090 [Sphingopyxis sp. HIX]KTE80455.1 hypothetical protein ATE72_17865 [Sphingopyxis sp. HXXIV]